MNIATFHVPDSVLTNVCDILVRQLDFGWFDKYSLEIHPKLLLFRDGLELMVYPRQVMSF